MIRYSLIKLFFNLFEFGNRSYIWNQLQFETPFLMKMMRIFISLRRSRDEKIVKNDLQLYILCLSKLYILNISE